MQREVGRSVGGQQPLRQRRPVVRRVPLGPDQAMAVLVSEDGAVENRVIALSGAMTSSALVEAGNYMSATLSGLTLAEARLRIERELAGKPDTTRVP